MEALDFTPGPEGSYPVAWGYRPGEHWRTVALHGVPVTLATSYPSVAAVLRSNAAPRARTQVIGHDRWPDFNTLPAGPGTPHSVIREVIRLALAGSGPQRRAVLRDAAAGLVPPPGGGPADLRQAYARPLTRALAASLGFPASDWDSCVYAPASIQQGLLSDGDGSAAKSALRDLLGYCQQLARELDDGSVLADIVQGLRARGLSHMTWHVLRTLATGSITPDAVLAAYLRNRLATPAAGLDEIMPYFGLMNPRHLAGPLSVPGTPPLPAGPVICSMDAAVHDPARPWPSPTLPWGLGPHGCPFYRDSRVLLEEAGRALGTGWELAGGLEIVPGLLPVPAVLPAVTRSPVLMR